MRALRVIAWLIGCSSALVTLVAATTLYWGGLQGVTPARMLDELDRRFRGHPKLEIGSAPALELARDALDAPREKERHAASAKAAPPAPSWMPPPQAAVPEGRQGSSRILRVGPGQAFERIADAAKAIRDGDVVEIAAGDYRGDVTVWPAKRFTLRSQGGMARLWADGKAAEGKAIWVFRGGDVQVVGIAFIGTRVPDRNGAGIRQEGGRLRIEHCLFWDNESGVLVGSASATRDAELEVHASEFGFNGHQSGQSHSLYAGHIRRLTITASHFHSGRVGHLVKSRANRTRLLFNRLVDGPDGMSSYEVDLPSGGLALLLGNTIQQSARTENGTMVSFGQEGLAHADNRLYLLQNTLVNDHPHAGRFVRLVPDVGPIVLANNLLLGRGELPHGDNVHSSHNPKAASSDFVNAANGDYRLRDPSDPRWQAVAPALDHLDGVPFRPRQIYRHPRTLTPLAEPLSMVGAQ